jgi:hypothetical protein
VARAVPQPFWFQLYMIRDRGFMQSLLQQARIGEVFGARLHGRHARARFALSRRPVGSRRRIGPARPAATHRPGPRAAGMGLGRGCHGTAASPRQRRTRARTEHRARGLLRVDAQQLRPKRHVARPRVGARAMGRAA